MSTVMSTVMSAEEKRVKKNEMTRLRRANSKNFVIEIEEVKASPEPSQEPSRELSPEPEPTPPTAEDIERKRKETINEKRRQSLIIARSKITPRSTIRKDAMKEVEEIKRIAYEEAEATKKKAEEDREVMLSLVKTKILSDGDTNKAKSKSVQPKKQRVVYKSQPPQNLQPPPSPPVPQPSQDLIQLSYTEQLKRRVRDYQYASAMHDTFG